MIATGVERSYSRIRSALSDLGSGLEFQWVESTEDALRFLRKKSPYQRAKTPALVIIDMASSMCDALVADMRKEVDLQSIPVVVVGTGPASQLTTNEPRIYIDGSVDPDAFHRQLKEACLFALLGL